MSTGNSMKFAVSATVQHMHTYINAATNNSGKHISRHGWLDLFILYVLFGWMSKLMEFGRESTLGIESGMARDRDGISNNNITCSNKTKQNRTKCALFEHF